MDWQTLLMEAVSESFKSGSRPRSRLSGANSGPKHASSYFSIMKHRSSGFRHFRINKSLPNQAMQGSLTVILSVAKESVAFHAA
jgi:hypothetical protein